MTRCNYKGYDVGEKDADDLVRHFWDEYQGQYDDEEDFAYQIVEECYDLPEFAKTYFGYKQFPVICSCATIGLMTALCSGQLEKDNPGGVLKPRPLKQRN